MQAGGKNSIRRVRRRLLRWRRRISREKKKRVVGGAWVGTGGRLIKQVKSGARRVEARSEGAGRGEMVLRKSSSRVLFGSVEFDVRKLLRCVLIFLLLVLLLLSMLVLALLSFLFSFLFSFSLLMVSCSCYLFTTCCCIIVFVPCSYPTAFSFFFTLPCSCFFFFILLLLFGSDVLLLSLCSLVLSLLLRCVVFLCYCLHSWRCLCFFFRVIFTSVVYVSLRRTIVVIFVIAVAMNAFLLAVEFWPYLFAVVLLYSCSCVVVFLLLRF